MLWRTDTRLYVRLFVACNVLLALYNFLTFNVTTRSTKPCVILGANNRNASVPSVASANPRHQVATANTTSSDVDIRQRGQYYVTPNLVRANRSYQANDSITLTTQGTIDFLHHVPTLCRRWGGPVSVAVYAPGPELTQALKLIEWLRQCAHRCVSENVTWHVVFDVGDEQRPMPENDSLTFNCSEGSLRMSSNYRQVTKKVYPINVLRNLARVSATTRYLLPSDIELYPSANIIPRFLKLLEMEVKVRKTPRNVYVLPIFEVDKDAIPPESKEELVALLRLKKAIYFHKWVCDSCQNFPGRDHWTDTFTANDTLNVFITAKRDRSRSSWEPIYIGTNDEPLYDERLSWDGKRDKMSQMYEMCLMQYTLLILDNAFLVHAPGIKVINKSDLKRRAPYVRQNNAYHGQAVAELKAKYGNNRNC